jgi:hypothetical protein
LESEKGAMERDLQKFRDGLDADVDKPKYVGTSMTEKVVAVHMRARARA